MGSTNHRRDEPFEGLWELAPKTKTRLLVAARAMTSDREARRRLPAEGSTHGSRLGPTRLLSRLSGLFRRLAATYRRTGADVPYGDPLPSHGTTMEGWFWRLTDPTSGRVIVALCGVNRHPAGNWATVAVAVHPGQVVRSAVLELADASRDELLLSAGTATGDIIEATADQLHIELGDLRLDVEFTHSFDWPKGLGGGGLFSALPYLNQYWHPYRLGGTGTGRLEHGGNRWQLDGDTVYAERNWGAGFPDLWWWGQAHDFPGDDLSVVFTGGLLRLGPIGRRFGAVVLRHGDQVIRITPPAPVRSDITPNRWAITARSPRYRIQLEGTGLGIAPHVLPVPIPDERRNVDRDFEHLAGRLRCTLHHRGKLVLDATSDLAGLEVGSLPGVDLPFTARGATVDPQRDPQHDGG